jgi:hypothetical protein
MSQYGFRGNAMRNNPRARAGPFRSPQKWKGDNMHVETHAPSTLVLVVTLVLVLLALVGYFVAPFEPFAFWVAILAVFAMVFGTLVKT